MENASKALLMAGGTLLAILILTVLIYTLNASNTLAQAQDEKKLAQQTSAFNKEYEAYEKSRMYGTDIITVVNKAIDYNQRLGVDDEDYKINIILVLNQDFDKTKKEITQKADGTKTEGNHIKVEDGCLKIGRHQLFEGSEKMSEDVISFFAQDPTDRSNTQKVGTTIVTTYTYSAITNFKRATFTCENVSYSPITGRVNSMTFKQI